MSSVPTSGGLDLMLSYLLLAGVVFGANLLPAFGPPTWSLLVFFRLQSHIPGVPLVLLARFQPPPADWCSRSRVDGFVVTYPRSDWSILRRRATP